MRTAPVYRGAGLLVTALIDWGLVSTRDVFSERELARPRGFPEIIAEELIRFFTLTGTDDAFVRSMRRPSTVLGVAVQLCSLPWLGFVPDDVAAAPKAAVARLGQRLGIDPGELAGYGRREQTRTDHLRAVMAYLARCRRAFTQGTRRVPAS